MILHYYRVATFKLVSNSLLFSRLQPSLQELSVDESDLRPARLILYSNLPIQCQGVERARPYNCWITFVITSSEDIAMRQRLQEGQIDYAAKKSKCKYQILEPDWKPSEGYAYDSNRSLDIVAKVDFSLCRH